MCRTFLGDFLQTAAAGCRGGGQPTFSTRPSGKKINSLAAYPDRIYYSYLKKKMQSATLRVKNFTRLVNRSPRRVMVKIIQNWLVRVSQLRLVGEYVWKSRTLIIVRTIAIVYYYTVCNILYLMVTIKLSECVCQSKM